MAETNLITTETMSGAQVREVEFVEIFTGGIDSLIKALNITRKIAAQPGTTLKAYKATGVLQDGNVAEGETIPLSAYTIEPIPYKEIAIQKHRKATTLENIQRYGFEQAVTMTTDKMLNDVQKEIKTDFFDFLATGTGTATGASLQPALADAWSELQILFEDDEIQSVYFINPKDVSAYLGTAQITTQVAFGMTYIENFLGLGSVMLSPRVPQGKFYATAKNNLVLYYLDVNNADVNEVFQFTTDETGLIGIHESPDYTNLTASDTVVYGLTLFAEMIDGVVVGTIAGE